MDELKIAYIRIKWIGFWLALGTRRSVAQAEITFEVMPIIQLADGMPRTLATYCLKVLHVQDKKE